MEYIRVENNVIAELVSCSERPGPEWQEINLEGGAAVGDDVRAFDADWNLRPLDDLVAEGIVEVEPKPEPGVSQPDKSADARTERDSRLVQMDRIVSNPLRWNEMRDDLKQLYVDYRQALLDVPQQSEFPENISWPTPPE